MSTHLYRPLTILIVMMCCVVALKGQGTYTDSLVLRNNLGGRTTLIPDPATPLATPWFMTLPSTVGATGSLLTSTVTGSNAEMEWLVPAADGQVLTLSGGVPTWASSQNWLLTGNTGTNAALNFLGTTDAVDLVLRTNNTEAVRVLSTGELGVGTSTPGQLLEVEDGNILIGTSGTGTAGAIQLQEDGTNGNDVVSLQAPSALAATTAYTLPDAFPSADGEVLSSTTAGVMSWLDISDLDYWSLTGNAGTTPGTGVGQNYVGTSDAAGFLIATNGTRRIGVTATGNVSIFGTAGTPNTTLTSLGGAAKVAIPAGYDRVVLADNTGSLDQVDVATLVGSAGWLLLGNSGTNPASNYLGTSDAQPLVFRTNAVETARFQTTGEFGIGTPTPSDLLEVEDGNIRIGTSGGGTAGALRFEEDGANGNNYVSFQAPSALAATTAYTLPTAFPATNGEVLSSTTAGVTSWLDISSLDYWSLTGNAATVPGTGAGQNYLGTSDAVDLVIATNSTQRLGVSATGDVTIAGTAGTPNTTVASLGGAAKVAIPAGYDRIVLANNTGSLDQVDVATIVGSAGWLLAGNAGTNPASNFLGTTDGQPLVIRTNNTEAVRVLTTGEVGIGTDTPTELLEVEDGNVLIGTGAGGTAGQLQFQENNNGTEIISFQAPAALAADNNYTLPNAYPGADGYFLQSTTAGVMSWFDPSSLASPFQVATAGQFNIRRIDALNNVVPAGIGVFAMDLSGNRTLAAQTASGQYSIVLNGQNLTATGQYAGALTGNSNTAGGQYSLVVGGQSNTNTGTHGFIGGGRGNNLTLASQGVLVGGLTNTVTGGTAAIVGGSSNTASATSSFIGGGASNAASGLGSVIGGGQNNITSSQGTAVVGGSGNTASGGFAFVGGGNGNTASGGFSSVLGGQDNTAGGGSSAVWGGADLTLSGANSGGFNSAGAMTVTASETVVFGSSDVWLANNDGSASQLRFYEPQGSTGAFPAVTTEYVAFQAPTIAANNQTYTLPNTVGTSTQVLRIAAAPAPTATTATLEWATVTAQPSVETFNVTANNQAIAQAGTTTFLRLNSNFLPFFRTVTLANGTTQGHVMIIRVIGNGSAAYGVRLVDNAGNLILSGTFNMNDGDTMTLIWDGGSWYETSRRNN